MGLTGAEPAAGILDNRVHDAAYIPSMKRAIWSLEMSCNLE